MEKYNFSYWVGLGIGKSWATYGCILRLFAAAACKQLVNAMIDGGNKSAASVFNALVRNSSAAGLSTSTSGTSAHRTRMSIRKPSMGRYGL